MCTVDCAEDGDWVTGISQFFTLEQTRNDARPHGVITHRAERLRSFSLFTSEKTEIFSSSLMILENRGCRDGKYLTEWEHVLFTRGQGSDVLFALMSVDRHVSPAKVCGSGMSTWLMQVG